MNTRIVPKLAAMASKILALEEDDLAALMLERTADAIKMARAPPVKAKNNVCH